MEIPDGEDELIIRGLIDKHYTNTNSQKAKEILENWEKALSHFVKVIPKDYKAVLIKKKVELLTEAI